MDNGDVLKLLKDQHKEYLDRTTELTGFFVEKVDEVKKGQVALSEEVARTYNDSSLRLSKMETVKIPDDENEGEYTVMPRDVLDHKTFVGLELLEKHLEDIKETEKNGINREKRKMSKLTKWSIISAIVVASISVVSSLIDRISSFFN